MRGRMTPEWVKRDYDLGTDWALEYVMDTLGRNLSTAGAIAYGRLLGRADREPSSAFDAEPTVVVSRPNPDRSVIYG